MKVTNTFEIPFTFSIGGKGKTDSKKSFFDKLFGSSSHDGKIEASDSETSMCLDGNILCKTEADISVDELKELFSESKEALELLGNGTYRKAFKEAGGCVVECLKEMADEALDYAPKACKKATAAYEAYKDAEHQMEQVEDKIEADDPITNEEVVEGLKAKVRRDLAEGYEFTSRDMHKKAEEGNKHAKLYVKLEAEILDELNSQKE